MIRFAPLFAVSLALAVAGAAPATAQSNTQKSKSSKTAVADKGKAAEVKPNLVASFGDWGVYQTPGAKGRVCYTLAQPKDRAPGELKRDPAYAFISDRPGEGVRNEISFIMGFEVANASDVESAKAKTPAKTSVASVGDENFELLAKAGNLWVKNAARESLLIDEMRKGAKLQVKAPSKKGNVTTDTYSLTGFSQALDRLQKDCPATAAN
jgi:invasion protein IalB